MSEIDAVVLGDGLNALGVLRSLGKHGVRIALVSRSARAIPAYSRHITRHVVIGRDECGAQRLLEKIEVAPREAVLFLTEELDVAACLGSADSWKKAFRTYFHTPEIALSLMRKSSFDRLARKHGAPLPKTVVVNESTNYSVFDKLKLPVVLKPSFRDIRFDEQFRKAYKVESPQALTELLERLRKADVELIVQEWIEGTDSDIYFNILYVDEKGKLCGSFVGQKILCWPTAVGGTASCLAAPQYHDELTSITRDFVREIGFRGLLGMEYKRDARDGQFYMIEPTVYRTDYQHEIAHLSGLALLPGIYHRCRGATGSFQVPYRRTRYWVDFPASRYSTKSEYGGRHVKPDVSRVDAYFRFADLMPGVMHYGRYMFAQIKQKILNRVRHSGNKEGMANNAG